MYLVSIIGVVIIAFILLWFARWALGQFPQGEPVDRLANVLIVLLGIAVLLWAVAAAFGIVAAPMFGRY